MNYDSFKKILSKEIPTDWLDFMDPMMKTIANTINEIAHIRKQNPKNFFFGERMFNFLSYNLGRPDNFKGIILGSLCDAPDNFSQVNWKNFPNLPYVSSKAIPDLPRVTKVIREHLSENYRKLYEEHNNIKFKDIRILEQQLHMLQLSDEEKKMNHDILEYNTSFGIDETDLKRFLDLNLTPDEQTDLEIELKDKIEASLEERDVIPHYDSDWMYENWAAQGVLMIPTNLTRGAKEEHIEIWEPFIKEFLKLIVKNYSHVPLVCWEPYYHSYFSSISNLNGNHLILTEDVNDGNPLRQLNECLAFNKGPLKTINWVDSPYKRED